MHTETDKLACVARELAMRVRVYARLVASGKKTQSWADQEIGLMLEIVQDYTQRAEKERLI